jgi:hypothetical protein
MGFDPSEKPGSGSNGGGIAGDNAYIASFYYVNRLSDRSHLGFPWWLRRDVVLISAMTLPVASRPARRRLTRWYLAGHYLQGQRPSVGGRRYNLSVKVLCVQLNGERTSIRSVASPQSPGSRSGSTRYLHKVSHNRE